MKFRVLILPIAVMIIVLSCFETAWAQREGRMKLQDAVDVMHAIMEIPETAIPPRLLKNVHAIAIIPEVMKAAFVVGGRHGKGVMIVRGKDGKWENPAFVTLTGGSVGWQIGAQSTDVVLAFKSRRSIDAIYNGKFTLGLDAAVAGGPVGRKAEAGTDIMLKAEILSYSRSRGLFAGVSLEGSALQINHEMVWQVYSRSVFEINREGYEAPAMIQPLKEVIKKYAH